MLLFMHNVMETTYLFIWQIHSYLQGSQLMVLYGAQCKISISIFMFSALNHIRTSV
jgi:hypothetical protein